MTAGSLLARTYELARQHSPHPNPAVGALITDSDGTVIAEGSHKGPGSPHAETEALSEIDSVPDGATLYVSLEPCSHTGRTPPCTDQIIASGIGNVVIGAVDPDPRVSGAGISALQAAGIRVEVVGDGAAEDVDRAYFHHRRTGLPLVTLKYGMTLDGSVAAADGTSQWITTEGARLDSHELRAEQDAVVVGAGTLRADDPSLSVRLDDYHGPQPRPVVILGESDPPSESQIWSRDPLVVANREVSLPSGDLVRVSGDPLPDTKEAMRAIADAGLLSVLVEGGPRLASSILRAGTVDRLVVYLGPKLGLGAGMAPIEGVFATIGDALTVEVEGIREISGSVRIDCVVRI